MQEYESAGEFTFLVKLKRSQKNNLIFCIIYFLGIIAYIIYLAVSNKLKAYLFFLKTFNFFLKEMNPGFSYCNILLNVKLSINIRN